MAIDNDKMESLREAISDFMLEHVAIPGKSSYGLADEIIEKSGIAADRAEAAIAKAGEPPVAYTGSGSIDAIIAGREGYIWPTKERAHPIPLYLGPALASPSDREAVAPTDEQIRHIVDSKDVATARSRLTAALALSAPGMVQGWQTMESAPRDGSKFLAFETGRYFDCWWHENIHGEAYWMDEADSEPNPSAWMPLPAPPAASPSKTKGAEQ